MMRMELQLGLALPNAGFDLNSFGYEPKELTGSDPSWNNFSYLGSAVSSKCSSNDFCGGGNNNKKRSFDDAFEQVKTVPETLPLLDWNDQPNDEDDHPKDLDNNSSFDSNKTSEEDGVVGWPPVKVWRKKLCHQHHSGRGKSNQITARNGSGCGSSNSHIQSNSMYVKVKMEGVAIARKIDLSLHDSFQTLTTTLINMFGLWHKESNNYTLTYQDREGDWLIAQDVPWRTFIRTAERLKLLKSND